MGVAQRQAVLVVSDPGPKVFLHGRPTPPDGYWEPAAPVSGSVIHHLHDDPRAIATRSRRVSEEVRDLRNALINLGLRGANDSHDPWIAVPWIRRDADTLHMDLARVSPFFIALRRETDSSAFTHHRRDGDGPGDTDVAPWRCRSGVVDAVIGCIGGRPGSGEDGHRSTGEMNEPQGHCLD